MVSEQVQVSPNVCTRAYRHIEHPGAPSQARRPLFLTARRASRCITLRNLSTAAHDIDFARRAAITAGRARGEARAGIAAVDDLLAIIEEGHLTGANRGSGLRPEWQTLLEDAGLTVPGEVARARTTVELHAVLLDWQEDLLSRRVPRGSVFRTASEPA